MTSDNGMPFPNAKATCYDAGIHVPLAICWGDRVKRKNTDVIISSIDFCSYHIGCCRVAFFKV